MVERLIITLIVLFVAIFGIGVVRRRQLRRARQASHGRVTTPNVPAIVYFWSPACSQCLSTQRPILERIVSRYGEGQLQLVAYNVEDAVDIAKAWGVTTVPTTFIVDGEGKVSHVNNGLATERRLRDQLQCYSTESEVIQ